MRALLNILFVSGVDVVRHNQVISTEKTNGAAVSDMVRNHQAVVSSGGVDVAAADVTPDFVTAGAHVALLEDTPNPSGCELEGLLEANGPTYKTAEGGEFTLGFQPKDARCENCGTGWSSSRQPRVYWSHNPYWNAEVATRDFWTTRAAELRKAGELNISHFGPIPFEACPDPFVRDLKHDVPGAVPGALNFVTGDRHCALPDNMKFLGEPCSHKSECTHLSKWVDMTCAPTTGNMKTGYGDKKCMYTEDAEGAYGGYDDNICECGFLDGNFGILSPGGWRCRNDDQCDGNNCVRSTRDMKFHCRAEEKGQCSNCRASEKACQHPDGSDIFTVDTTAQVIAKGYLSIRPAE